MSPEKSKKYAIMIIAVFCLIIVTGIGNFRAQQLAVNLTGDRVTHAIDLAAAELNLEKLQELIQSHDEKGMYYEELRSDLIRIKTDHELENIYILYKDESSKEKFYIADARQDDDPMHIMPGQLLERSSSAIENTLKGKVVHDVYYTTSLGEMVSSYQGIKDSNGKTIAVIAGDVQAGSFTQFLFLTRYVQMGIIAVSLILIGCVSLIGKKRLKN
ncbi:hypothetical protein LPY66_02940 [Dehalobacter sp. DCM]|uniref:hypothetical protein n=1 Tax=Dehalobacter sp. DCM TaxID=2907827 RepID=UPI0030821A45|nr:hypothetical protein LPY66_02940 [Dehalobacter sp. DCM]